MIGLPSEEKKIAQRLSQQSVHKMGTYNPTWRHALINSALSIMVLALTPGIWAAITIACIVEIVWHVKSRPPQPLSIVYGWARWGRETVSLPLAIIADALSKFYYWARRLAREIKSWKPTESRYWRRRRQVMGTEILEPYLYPKLYGKHKIRLFEIHPGGGDGQDEVRARIIQSNLLWGGHSYDAISYTWADENGNSDRRENISLLDQGATVAVTSNCITLLEQLRYPNKRRRVWIDAICIDQQSDSDRYHQVHRMDRIYMSAKKVIAYTGEATAESDMLFDWMNSVHPKDLVLPTSLGWADVLDTEGQTWPPSTGQLMAVLDKVRHKLSIIRHKASFSLSQWWSARFGTWSGEAPVDDIVSLSDQQATNAATEYFSRRWFQRVWILQEVSLPDARRVVVKCGAKSTSAMRALHSLSLLPSDGSGALTLGRFYLMPRKKIMRPKTSHLLDLLIETRDRYCSDPRDKVFGLLSIANRLDEDRFFYRLSATYDRSVAQVCAYYSKFFIRQHGLAFFWSLIKSSRELPDLPSWSADWSVPWPNYKAVQGRHFPATSRNNGLLDHSWSYENDSDGSTLLGISLRTIIRGVFTKNGHLDGYNTKTRTIEEVGNLEEGHHLVELHPGVCALLRESRHHYEFIQVCSHHLELDGLCQVVDAWTEYVVDGKIPEFGDAAGGEEGHEYLSGLRRYSIR